MRLQLRQDTERGTAGALQGAGGAVGEPCQGHPGGEQPGTHGAQGVMATRDDRDDVLVMWWVKGG